MSAYIKKLFSCCFSFEKNREKGIEYLEYGNSNPITYNYELSKWYQCDDIDSSYNSSDYIYDCIYE